MDVFEATSLFPARSHPHPREDEEESAIVYEHEPAVFPANALESVGRQGPEKVDRENALVRRDVDQDVQGPSQHLEHWTPSDDPDKCEDCGEDQQAVTAMVELPDELKTLRAVRVGH